jgi:hypothetical protein
MAPGAVPSDRASTTICVSCALLPSLAMLHIAYSEPLGVFCTG